jgi:SAM-dependent methyltransferase
MAMWHPRAMSSNYDPTLYDLSVAQDFGGDVHWYTELAKSSGGPVLELGAGTGRVLLPIAEAGVEITGLDLDSAMLEALRAKVAEKEKATRERIAVVQGDMRDFRLDREFALVIIPFRAFLHNLTFEDQLACLRSCHNQLRGGGMLAFNVFHPSLRYMAANDGAMARVWRWTGEAALPDGGWITRSEAAHYDTVGQLVHARHRLERFNARGEHVETFMQRLELAYLYPGDLRRLLEHAEFEDIDMRGGFDGRPFSEDGDELVVTARKP